MRYEDADPEVHRDAAQQFLKALSERLEEATFLMGDQPMLADWAIFPFIRQFANIDRARFDACNTARLREWLDWGLASARFQTIMKKGSRWAQ